MKVKPLSQLLAEADRFIKPDRLAKTASQAAPLHDEVTELADQLMTAEAVAAPAASEIDPGVEKLAMAMNRAEAALQVATLKKIAQFEQRALAEGFTQNQIDEVVENIAAKHLAETLPSIASNGGGLLLEGLS
jgi:tellurite resistance protein